jgi:hypothetical protein
MLSSEEQMQILKEALLQGHQGPIFELIDEANVEAYQKQAQAAQQQSQETPSVGTPALGGEFEAKAPQSSTERNIIQPGQYKKGGVKKEIDPTVEYSTQERPRYSPTDNKILLNIQDSLPVWSNPNYKSADTDFAHEVFHDFQKKNNRLTTNYEGPLKNYNTLDSPISDSFRETFFDRRKSDLKAGIKEIKEDLSKNGMKESNFVPDDFFSSWADSNMYSMPGTAEGEAREAEGLNNPEIANWSKDYLTSKGYDIDEYKKLLLKMRNKYPKYLSSPIGPKKEDGDFKSGGIKKYTDGGVKLSMGAEANHECGPGVQNCGDRESPFTLQRYTGFNYNTGNKNVGMDLDLGTQFSFGKDDTRSGAPVLQTGLSGDASMNIESFKNSEVDNAFNYGVDAYAKVGYKRKSLSSSAKRTNSPGFEAGVYGNYDLLNKNINDVGVYGKYGAFTGNVGYNPQTKGGMLGIGLKFKEGGVRRYNHGGPHSNMTMAELSALTNQIQTNPTTETPKNKTSKTNPTSKTNTDKVSTTQGSYYYNKDGSGMTKTEVQNKNNQKAEDTKKHATQAKEDIKGFLTDPVQFGDGLGMTGIPIVSEAGDIISGLTSAYRGNYDDAALSAAGLAIPFAGGKVLKGANNIYQSTKTVLNESPTMAKHLLRGNTTGPYTTTMNISPQPKTATDFARTEGILKQNLQNPETAHLTGKWVTDVDFTVNPAATGAFYAKKYGKFNPDGLTNMTQSYGDDVRLTLSKTDGNPMQNLYKDRYASSMSGGPTDVVYPGEGLLLKSDKITDRVNYNIRGQGTPGSNLFQDSEEFGNRLYNDMSDILQGPAMTSRWNPTLNPNLFKEAAIGVGTAVGVGTGGYYLSKNSKEQKKGGVRKYHIKKCKYGGCL